MPLQRPLQARPDVRLVRSADDAQAEVAGAHAFGLFCTPASSSRRTADHDALVERARFHLRSARTTPITTSLGRLTTYTFEPEHAPLANVLLVHGWSAEAAFLGAFAEFLRRRGFRTVLVDLPAHGQNSGRQTNLVDCGRAVLEVAEAAGPFRFALGHSIGAMAVLMAGEGKLPLPRAYPFEAYALISMPDRFGDVTGQFSDEIGLSPAARRNFEKRLERLAGRRIAHFTGGNLLAATGKPTLLLHSRDDEDVPFACAEAMQAARPNAELIAFEGLGHRAILYAPPVVRAAAAFLTAQAGS